MKTYASVALSRVVGFALCVWGIGSLAAAGTRSITVPNFSFEAQPSSSDNLHNVWDAATTTYIQDWTVSQQNGSTMGTVNYNSDPDADGRDGPAGRLPGHVVRILCDHDDVGEHDEQRWDDGGQYGLCGDGDSEHDVHDDGGGWGVPSNQLPPSGSDAPGVVLSLVDSDVKYIRVEDDPVCGVEPGDDDG